MGGWDGGVAGVMGWRVGEGDAWGNGWHVGGWMGGHSRLAAGPQYNVMATMLLQPLPLKAFLQDGPDPRPRPPHSP